VTILERREKQDIPQARYERMRQLLKVTNHRRRRLRDKVDLLCKDLVHSNQQFTDTLHGLRRAYDFQSRLTGEFDLRYLLYKALREMKSDLSDASAAIYLCDCDEFTAHLASAWFEEGSDIVELEELFRETLVPQALDKQRPLLVPDGAKWQSIPTPRRERLRGISLMALPVIFTDEPIGVVIFYRPMDRPFTEADRNPLLPLLKPLAQAITSVRKLQGLILQN
jgi:GAF domain-containing protein